jgi:hypothetical protein
MKKYEYLGNFVKGSRSKWVDFYVNGPSINSQQGVLERGKGSSQS